MTTPAVPEPMEPAVEIPPTTVINQIAPAPTSNTFELTAEDLDGFIDSKKSKLSALAGELTALQAEYEDHQQALARLQAAKEGLASGGRAELTLSS